MWSDFDVLNALNFSSSCITQADLVYGPKPRHKLDVFRAKQASSITIVFLYGGNWRKGNKVDYRYVGTSLARRNINAVLIDYRLYPEVVFPEFIHDAQMAVNWVFGHGEELFGQAQKVFLMGHSAGAHIAANVAYQTIFAPNYPVDGFIGLSGPYLKFLPTQSEDLKQIFGQEPCMQTQGLIDAKLMPDCLPKALLVHGESDQIVLPRESRAFAELLMTRGASVDLKLFSGKGHAVIAASLATILSWRLPILKEIEQFVFQ